MKTIIWDLETSDMHGEGNVLVFGYKELGGPTQTLSLLDYPRVFRADPTDDSRLVREAHKVLTDAEIVVTYYGKEFDQKLLNTRVAYYDLPPLPPLGPEHVDMYFTVKSKFLLRRKSLENVGAFFGCPVEKSPFELQIWNKARAGHAESMEYVIDHCERDVDILEWVYMKLRPYIRMHPRVGLHSACRVCGSANLQRRGFAVSPTLVHRRQRVQCQDCGAWSTLNTVGSVV